MDFSPFSPPNPFHHNSSPSPTKRPLSSAAPSSASSSSPQIVQEVPPSSLLLPFPSNAIPMPFQTGPPVAMHNSNAVVTAHLSSDSCHYHPPATYPPIPSVDTPSSLSRPNGASEDVCHREGSSSAFPTSFTPTLPASPLPICFSTSPNPSSRSSSTCTLTPVAVSPEQGMSPAYFPPPGSGGHNRSEEWGCAENSGPPLRQGESSSSTPYRSASFQNPKGEDKGSKKNSPPCTAANPKRERNRDREIRKSSSSQDSFHWRDNKVGVQSAPGASSSTVSMPELSPPAQAFLPLLPSSDTPLFSIVPAFSAVSSTFYIPNRSLPETVASASSNAKERSDAQNHEKARNEHPSADIHCPPVSSSSYLSLEDKPIENVVFTLSSLHRLLQQHAEVLCRQYRCIVPSHSFSTLRSLSLLSLSPGSRARDPHDERGRESGPHLAVPATKWRNEGKRNVSKGVVLPPNHIVLQAVAHLQQLLHRRVATKRGRWGGASTPNTPCRGGNTSGATAALNTSSPLNDNAGRNSAENRKGKRRESEKGECLPNGLGEKEEERCSPCVLPNYGLRYTDALEVLSLLQFLTWYCLESTAVQLQEKENEKEKEGWKKDSEGDGTKTALCTRSSFSSAASTSLSSPFFFFVPSTSAAASPAARQHFSSGLGRRPLLPEGFLAPPVATLRRTKADRNAPLHSAVSSSSSSFAAIGDEKKHPEDRCGEGIWNRNVRPVIRSTPKSGRSSHSQERTSSAHSTVPHHANRWGGWRNAPNDEGDKEEARREGKKHVDPHCVGSASLSSLPPSSSLASASSSSFLSVPMATYGERKPMGNGGDALAEHVCDEEDDDEVEEWSSEEEEQDSRTDGMTDAQCSERLFAFLLGEEWLVHLAKATDADRVVHSEAEVPPHEKAKKETMGGERAVEMGAILPSPSTVSTLLVSLHFYSLVLLAVALLRYDAVANGIFLTRLFSPVDPSDLFLTAVPSHFSFTPHAASTTTTTPSSSASASPSVVLPGNAKKGKEAAKKNTAVLLPPPPPPPPPSVVSLPYSTPSHPLLFPFLHSPHSAIRWAAGLTLQHLVQYLSCFLIAEEPLPSRRGGPPGSAGGDRRTIRHENGNPRMTGGGGTTSTAMATSFSSYSSPSSFVPLSVHSGMLLLQLHAILCWMLSAADASLHVPSSSSASPLLSLHTTGLALLSSSSTFPLLWQLLVTIISVTPYRRCPLSLERVRVMLSLFSMEKKRPVIDGGEWGTMTRGRMEEEADKAGQEDPPPCKDPPLDDGEGDHPTERVQPRHKRARRRKKENDANAVQMAPLLPSSLLSSSSALSSSSPPPPRLSPSSHRSVAVRVLRDNLCRQAVVAFVAQCICRVHYPSSSPTSVEGSDSNNGGEREKERSGTMDMRVMFSCGERDASAASSSSFLSSPLVPLRLRGEGKGQGGGGGTPRQKMSLKQGCQHASAPPHHPTTTDPPLGTQLCDALLDVSSSSTSRSLSAWSSMPCDDTSLHTTEEGPPMKGTHVGYVFSSVDWLCMTAFLRFFPDRIEAFPYRLEALLYQTTFTLERFYRSYYGTSSCPLFASGTASCVPQMHPSTAANTAAALAEALRCWNHFIGYVWTSFDGKPDDLALLHPQPSAVIGTTTHTPSNASSAALSPSTGRVSVSSKCVVVACVFLPIWRCLLRLYQRHRHGEKWCWIDIHSPCDAIRRSASCTDGKEGMSEEWPDDMPHSRIPSSVSLTPPLYLPPIPVVRMALRAAANLSEACVAAMRRTACGMEEEEEVDTTLSHSPPTPPTAAFSLSAAAIVSRFRTAMPSGNTSPPDEDGLKDVMVSFVRYCVEYDPRTEVRAEALQTIGVWCWAYPSLDAILLHSGLYRLTVDVLRADADVHCRSKAAWALSNLCARLADPSDYASSPPEQNDGVAAFLLSPTAIREVVPKTHGAAPIPKKEREGMHGAKDTEGVDDRRASTPPHPSPPSFSLRHQPVLMQSVCEAALCATSWRMQREAENSHPMPGYARNTTRSSSSSSSSTLSSAASLTLDSVIHHGVRMMRALLQLLTVEECLQCAPKCPMDRRGMLGNDDEKGWGGEGENQKNRTTMRNGVRNTKLMDEEEEVVIEAFLTRLTRFLSSTRNVKLRWNAAMALGVAVSRKDIFEAEPLGTSSAILLLCDVLQRDTFFKVRIRVVEALGGVCMEGLQGEYSAHGDYTPIVIQAMCEALEKCQSTPFPAGPQGDEKVHRNKSHDGTHGSVGEKVATSQRDSDAMDGIASPPIRHQSGTLETATSAPGTRPSIASSSSVPSTSFSSPSGIEQGRQELHRVTVATIAKILRTAKPSAALDGVLKRNAGVLKRVELA